ncbi:hypothetical protein QET93_007490 [Akkermansia sp. N21116]|jgi:hypothetical protein|nr:hypothetical protein [Akkermansia sp. N21116]WPX39380.1 hypothetical protein QET93_007490 [Akkermansia sp. N21116]
MSTLAVHAGKARRFLHSFCKNDMKESLGNPAFAGHPLVTDERIC